MIHIFRVGNVPFAILNITLIVNIEIIYFLSIHCDLIDKLTHIVSRDIETSKV